MDWLSLLGGLVMGAGGVLGAMGLRKHLAGKRAPGGRAAFEDVEQRVKPPPARRDHYLDDEL